MALSCGIIGLPTVGKTTLFNLLTNAKLETSNFMTGKTTTHTRTAKIPDERVDKLAELYNPKKVTYATLEITDVPGLVKGSSKGMGSGNEFLQGVREADALIHVARAFSKPEILHIEGSIDILRDLETVNLELLFADLQLIENRINRIEGQKKVTQEHRTELSGLKKIQEVLEAEKPITQAGLTESENQLLRHTQFLTSKPMILVINLDEDQLIAQSYPNRKAILEYAALRAIPLLEVSVLVEEEISELSIEDQVIFLEDLGIEEPGINKIAKTVYQELGLISFLTAGEDEVKAWTIAAGLNAKQAAGKIHSDIEKGFIRAETVGFNDLMELGSMVKVKEKGLARLEGKDYLVKDGDIINFRFNV